MNQPVDTGAFASGLDKCTANFTQLSPLSFIRRTASVYPEYPSIIHGQRRFTWSETYARCRQLASALSQRGIGAGDTVAALVSNTPAMYEAHFGVSMAGAILNTINTRLDAATIAFILDHGEARVLLTDKEFHATAYEALGQCRAKPLVIDVDDAEADGEFIGETEYEAFIGGGDKEFEWSLPRDEWQAISLNYTSGTTGDPKGVVYHHRGAYLNAISNIVGWNMGHHPVYLWTLPMFHCNGWCFPWTIAAVAGTNVCLRRVTGANIYRAIADQKVTHFCGAPIVLSMVINAPPGERRTFDHKVRAMTAAAPPPASVLASMEEEGFDVTHVYGLTETYGPAVMCAWKDRWNELSPNDRAQQKSRQGVTYHALEGLDVIDPETMKPVPRDGETIGEVMFQGNIVMKGYLKNPDSTASSLSDGWFHSGDLGVMHPDNYIQIKDRSKDIIISGGENISSIEVEDTLYKFPGVEAAAVVARPDEKWGETPCAFVTLRPDTKATEKEVIEFCRDNLAHFKCPRTVIFTELPKTSTGKIQKFKLREQARELGDPA